jgi:nitrogen fixation/metabolism regulation signal transduction histidine kinase
MRNRMNIREVLVAILLFTAAILLGFSISVGDRMSNPDTVAQKISKTLEKRMSLLDHFISTALTSELGSKEDIRKLPDDMVIYRYYNDSLQSWSNQFPVNNDDIGSRLILARLTPPYRGMGSPLAEITSQPVFKNYGSKWYIMKAESLGSRKVIAGLLIMDSMNDSQSEGVNKHLELRSNYSIIPLSETGGSPVVLEGEPVFKVANESMQRGSIIAHSTLIWMALFLFIIAAIIHLTQKRTFKRLIFVIAALLMALAAAYLWGLNIRNYSKLFSPTVYANGQFLNSLGALLLLSATVVLVIFCIFLTRRNIYIKILESKDPKNGMLTFIVINFLVIIGICCYVHFIFMSVILNSNICLELYKISELSIYSGIVYLMIMAVMVTIPLIFRMMAPPLKRVTGSSLRFITQHGELMLSIIFGLYAVAITGVLGFKKEQNLVSIWANQLSIDRDISLELQLRESEEKIANDQVIASLSDKDNINSVILNRIVENYLYRVAQNNDLAIELFREKDLSQRTINYLRSILANGTQIASSSRFLYLRDESGHTIYSGNFVYYNENKGVTNMLLTVSPKSNKEDRGYASLLGYSAPGEVVIPSKYSYGKYVSDKLLVYKGNCSYPTVLDPEMKEELLMAKNGVQRNDGWTHFINNITDYDLIIISRPKYEDFSYIVEFLFLALALFLGCSALTIISTIRRRRKTNSYFKSRINAAIMIALLMTLIALACVSIFFVYKRNLANLRSSMTERVSSIQTLLQARCRYSQSYRDLESQEASGILDDISNTMKCDITLYTPGGKLFRSTTPEIFDRMLIGSRMNQKAYEDIAIRHLRFCIHNEKIGNSRTYMLYAPLFNVQNNVVAIFGSPYTDDSFDFRNEAFYHIATIITVFLILLILARMVTARAVDKMFRPVSEISSKMNKASIDNLEYIVYEQEDEISSLVRAYNLMVHDLYNSTKQLTQAERDKAWATMARQVAHEIKNPLTPIKLQIQRLIRMKSNGNSAWADRFDDVSGEVLKQIDLLADTANEFSTFAKLYTEDPVEIDLDKLLKEEIGLFDNHEDIEISYMGLDKATAIGPKPQLTRVFTNLISNAIQAVEGEQIKAREEGTEPMKGRIVISLRLSQKDGFYDIVFEDNGPGVSDANRDKLFTPNFTTKSNGTGLGLSICRNILEKCNGEIHYSKSFSLGGACFTVRLPRNKN